MSLQERLDADLKEAMRRGDAVRRSVIRLAKAAIHNAEIAEGSPLTEAGVTAILLREVKQRRESIAEYRKGNRQDLVAQEEAELAVLWEYLPKQLSRDEIVAEARKIIAETGAQGPADKGKVMGRLMAQLTGKADGREVSEVVSELLSR